MVLAQDLSLVAQWLGSILAHEDKIKKYIPQMLFFFFFEILNLEYIYIFKT
jgi:hypothetical protein